VLRWNRPRGSARRESLYQSASKTIKRHSVGGAKTPKIRAELFFHRARAMNASQVECAAIRILNRRRCKRFRETIEQHFRRALVSKRFRSCERGSSHEMGAGAIGMRAIEIASTETSDDDRANAIMSRRRRRDLSLASAILRREEPAPLAFPDGVSSVALTVRPRWR
jgi:hypothetical protein